MEKIDLYQSTILLGILEFLPEYAAEAEHI